MDDATPAIEHMNRIGFSTRHQLKRRAATIAARCAMRSWLVLAAMPIVVMVYSLA